MQTPKVRFSHDEAHLYYFYFRQSYDVDISLNIPGTNNISTNSLDLKNPFFRYTGQQPQQMPGTSTQSPSDAYWNSLVTGKNTDQQPQQMPGNGTQYPQMPTGIVSSQVCTWVSNHNRCQGMAHSHTQMPTGIVLSQVCTRVSNHNRCQGTAHSHPQMPTGIVLSQVCTRVSTTTDAMEQHTVTHRCLLE